MGLESASHIADLNASNPVGATDKKSQGDDHIRLIKSVLKTDFAGIDGPVTATDSELNILDADNTFNLDNATADLDGTTFTADYTTITLTGGSAVVTLSGTEIDLTAATLDLNGALDVSGVITGPNGSSSAPSYSFTGDPDTGLYRAGANNPSITCGGTIVASFATTQVTIASTELQFDGTTLDLNGTLDVDGGAHNISDGTGSIAFSGTGTITLSGGAQLESINGMDIVVRDGGYLRAFDSGDTDYLQITHDGTDGNITGFQAAAINVVGAGLNAYPDARNITDTGNTASTDQGIVIRMTAGASKTFTLDGDPPTNAVVILDNSSGNAWTIAASGTLIDARDGTTGSMTLADDGLAVALHRGSGVWIISGGGLG